MIAVASFKPFERCSEEIIRNQIRAKESWNRVFDGIIYFGNPEPRLTSERTTFIESENFPKMSAMFLAAAMTGDIAAILNADIVVAPEMRTALERAFNRAGAVMSFRYEFDSANPDYRNAKQVDHGLDFFASYPDLWVLAHRTVPEDFRVGHEMWDTWCMNFFHSVAGQFFLNLTDQRLIFHPKHGERTREHYIERNQDVFSRGLRFTT